LADTANPLAPYAAHGATSRGRRYPEPAAGYRSGYQRDRDRIVHTNAFRRLVYKTQVFVNHEGDHYRTRLTHSLEVAQIARTIALALRLNETLVEAICLAHDLGHTPFGHAGQDALNACMRDFGGFEHNLQSLRIVDELEENYAEFRGLNLTFETREGILKHCSRTDASRLGDVGERFLLRRQPGLEAQLANVADAIAYNNHDVDDGIRAGLLSVDALRTEPLFSRSFDAVMERYPDIDHGRLVYETKRRMIDRVVSDLIEESGRRIAAAAPGSIDDVRDQPGPLIAMSDAVYGDHMSLKRFLRKNLYQHEQVRSMTDNARRIVRELFAVYLSGDAALPPEFARRAAGQQDERGRARVIADYIAGMTDRYAIRQHEQLAD
jgi:dGTPase